MYIFRPVFDIGGLGGNDFSYDPNIRGGSRSNLKKNLESQQTKIKWHSVFLDVHSFSKRNHSKIVKTYGNQGDP